MLYAVLSYALCNIISCDLEYNAVCYVCFASHIFYLILCYFMYDIKTTGLDHPVKIKHCALAHDSHATYK